MYALGQCNGLFKANYDYAQFTIRVLRFDEYLKA
jgi:hypothetical protein